MGNYIWVILERDYKKWKKGETMHNKIKRGDLDWALVVIAMIAQKENITPAQVRAQLNAVIFAGMNAEDPETRARWSKCPCRGTCPTPEEYLLLGGPQMSDT